MRKNENGKTETDSGAEPLGLNERLAVWHSGKAGEKGKASIVPWLPA